MSDFEGMKASLAEVCGLVNGYIEKCSYFYDYGLEEVTEGLLAYLMRPGKKLRPAVLVWSYLASGGSEKDLASVLPVACGLELTHTWTLIHDDIIDRDESRRGGESMHVIGRRLAKENFGASAGAAEEYGLAYSILIGDALHAVSVAMMLDAVKAGAPSEVVGEICRLLQGVTMRELLEGELRDVNFEYMPTEAIDCDTILKMIEGKTSSLLSYSAMFGAMLGKKTADTGHPAVKSIGDYARACGTAFQLKDDILGLVADEAELGKPVGSDLRDGKKSYPIYLALSRFGEKERAEFLQIYGNGKASPQRQKRAVDMILETGAVRDTESLAVRLVTEAGGLLKDMPDSRYKSYLLAWGAYLVDRSR